MSLVARHARALPPPAHDGWDWPAVGVETHRLPNGLKVLLSAGHAAPFVWLGWVTAAGAERDEMGYEGLAALTPLALREGTLRRSATRLAQEAEDLAAQLALSCDWDGATVALEVLTPDLAPGLELLLDLACNPRLGDETLTLVRRRRLTEIEQRRGQAATVADDSFAHLLFGTGLYGRSPLGSAESLARLDEARLQAFHARHYAPANACLVLAGNFDAREALALTSSFDPCRGSQASDPPRNSAERAPRLAAQIIDWPGASQTELRVGHVSVSRADADLPALQLLAALLGGGPSSRLSACLRQRLGVTYHVRSRFVARRGGGFFAVESRVANEAVGAARTQVARELERLREDLVPTDELERTRRRLLGQELRRFQYAFDTGSALGQAAFDADPLGALERRRERLTAITAEELRDVARGHLQPGRLAVVAVGPADALRRQLGETGSCAEPVAVSATTS